MFKYLFVVSTCNSTNFCLATRNLIFGKERDQTDTQFFWVKLVISVVSWNLWSNLKHWSHWKITRIILWWRPWIHTEVFFWAFMQWQCSKLQFEKIKERIVARIFIFTQVSNAEHKVPPSFGKSSQVEHKAGHSEPLIESSLLAGSAAGKCKCLSFTPQKKPPVFHAIFCLSHSTWTDWGTHQALPEAEQLVMPLWHTVCHLPGIQTDTHRQALGHRHISLLKPIT